MNPCSHTARKKLCRVTQTQTLSSSSYETHAQPCPYLNLSVPNPKCHTQTLSSYERINPGTRTLALTGGSVEGIMMKE